MIPRTILIFAILLLTWCGHGHTETLQDRVMAVSAKYLYVRETHGSNRSPDIDRWNRFLGLPLGSPYCAAFGVWVYHQAGHPLPKIGRCCTLWRRLQANELRYKTFSAEEVQMGIEKIQPADIIIWRSGNGVSQNWNGHFGIAKGGMLPTREANTMPGNTGNQREGGGVYDRRRTLGFGSSFRVVGFARVR